MDKSGEQKFRLVKFRYWPLGIGIFLGPVLYNSFFKGRPWWFEILFTFVWYAIIVGGSSLLWNKWRPYYLRLDNACVWIGKTSYRADEIEAIEVTQKKGRYIRIIVKRELLPINVTPWKGEREKIRYALQNWADDVGVKVQAY